MSESRSTRPAKPVHFKKKALIAAVAVLPFIAITAFPTPRTLTTYGIQIKMPEAVAIGEEGDIENDTQAKLPAKLIVASNSDIEEKTAALSYHSGDPISEDDLQTAGQAGDQAGAIGFGPTTQDYALIGETSPGFDFGAQAFSGGNSGSGSGQSGVSGGSAQSGSTGGQQIASAGSTGTSGSSGSAGGTTNTGGETGNTGSTGGGETANTGGETGNTGSTGGGETANTGGETGNTGSTGGGEAANTGGGSENDGSTGGGEAANTGGGSENDGSTGGGETANTGGGSENDGSTGGGETANTGGGSENDGSTGGGEAANTGGGSENDGSTGGGEAPSGPTVINNDPEEVIIAGLFKPGHSPGIENFNNLTLLSTATTEIEIGGLAAGLNPDGFDQVNVAGLLTLGGVLDILLYNGFFPTAGNEFQIFTFGSLAGGFSKINGRDIGGGCSFEYILNTNDITLRTIGACAGHPGNGNVNSSITSNSYEDITIQSAFLPGLNPAFEQVPEPGMLVIFGLGLVGMGVIRRRRRA